VQVGPRGVEATELEQERAAVEQDPACVDWLGRFEVPGRLVECRKGPAGVARAHAHETQLPEHRDLNLVATSPPVAIGTAPADGGRVEVELVVDALPVTPTELEVTLVLTGPRGEIHDELAAPLTVEGPPARPKYRMRVTPV